MIIGVYESCARPRLSLDYPREIKDNEYRVGIVPSTVRELADKGYSRDIAAGFRNHQSCHTCPGRKAVKRSCETPVAFNASVSAMNGALIGSSVSWNVP